MEDGSFTGFLRRFIHALDEAGVPYMIVGSLASSLHGVPRSTRDVDIVVSLSRASIARLSRLLPEEEYYFDADVARESLKTRVSFNVIDMQSLWKADMIPLRGHEFARLEFARRVKVPLEGIEIAVASAEDTLIGKMVWAKKGETEQQLKDAAGVMLVQGDRLDLGYVEKWVGELGLEEQWKAVRKIVSETS